MNIEDEIRISGEPEDEETLVLKDDTEDEIRISGEPEDEETLVLKDESGRTIACTVERHLEIKRRGQNKVQEYVLLLPCDAPVEIFAWASDDEDDEEAIPVDDEDIDERLFNTAKAVLEEQNLTLKRTALMLTVEGEGDILDFEEDEDFETIATDDDDGAVEELRHLATFFVQGKEFAIYAPLDPCFILARLDEDNQAHILSSEELQYLEPVLEKIEAQLVEDLEDLNEDFEEE